MAHRKADIQTDMKRCADRGESPALMEPLMIPESSKRRAELNDLVIELVSRSAGFRRSLPDSIISALAHLVRSMNCYYSNLIEGHNTHPIDIERALQNNYSSDTEKRNLQLEARAHIALQEWIDNGGLAGILASKDAILEIHKRFCAELPEDLLIVSHPSLKEPVKMEVGGFRDRDVQIGAHVAISPGAIPRFLDRFEEVYGSLGRSDRILSVAAQHHRFLWIHPFLDGNGRVARLMSHASLLDTLDTGSIWSVARGLARNVSDYKAHLSNCDLPRRNNLDGRGSLSLEALEEFSIFFLKACIDQVKFMEELMEPHHLRTRILMWAEEELRIGTMQPKAKVLIESILFHGTLPRGDIPSLLGVSERQARRITSDLITAGVITSSSTRAPLRLAFPATLAARWMPGLFPEKTA